ncbi:LacI family transcriptional regulator [Streptomyces sp. SID14478]|uniref:LacI family DNA-binding transcriptional regulator n=1 Tax=Streptomyces sp. SID14478 TaxID=2706073 RepID=UPI0013DF6DC0|nr:LacI family DNA-binding transcriptional regulator [Streptomyces sp. SID14478]NEB81888.1 LacI family transcriptional regulator [Streptomyces sp. SID14478]
MKGTTPLASTPPAKPTSADVARLAGVSRATVSRVVNDPGNSLVTEETRRRVLDAVRSLGYTPHASARALRAGRTHLILMPLVRAPLGRAVDQLIENLSRDLAARGLRLLIDADRSVAPEQAAHSWAEHRPDAVIGGPATCPPEAVRVLRNAGVDTVVLLDSPRRRDATALGFHDAAVAATAARHLLDTGHRRLACLVPEGPSRQLAQRRLERVRELADAAGAVVEAVPCSFGQDELRLAAARWRGSRERPTAVYAFDDDYALMLIHVLRESGLSVPEDIAVIGSGNFPLGGVFTPRLTTTHFDMSAVSAAVCEALTRLLQGKSLPRGTRAAMEPVLTVRESA